VNPRITKKLEALRAQLAEEDSPEFEMARVIVAALNGRKPSRTVAKLYVDRVGITVTHENGTVDEFEFSTRQIKKV